MRSRTFDQQVTAFLRAHPADVHALITRLARRFPGSALVFDDVPRWTSAATTRRLARTETSMDIPPMPWPVDGREARSLRDLVLAVWRLEFTGS